MVRFQLDLLRDRLLRPAIFFPLLAGLAVLSVYGVIQAGLAVTDRWEQRLAARMAYYRSHQPTVLVSRYEERLSAVRVALRKRGYDAGPTGAAMGPHTADALRSFQRRQGLPVTGRADQSTVTALGLEP
jgi:peptidoglycan hydrolase-like protein with peptidoglycan-binding domain